MILLPMMVQSTLFSQSFNPTNSRQRQANEHKTHVSMKSLRLKAIQQKLFILIPTTLFCIVTDQGSKYMAKIILANHDQISLLGGWFTFSYIENPYGFLGIFTQVEQTPRQILLLGCVLLLLFSVVLYILQSKTLTKPTLLYLSMIFGGGLSNLLDRFIQSIGVIDFMSFGYGSIRTGLCNMADIYILVGGFCLGFLITKDLH